MPIYSGGGGGSSVTPASNWCTISFASVTLSAAGNQFYNYAQADLSIFSQSGTDFTIGNGGAPSDGAVISAAGGWFVAAMFLATPTALTLDAGRTAQRWLEVGAVTGNVSPFPSPSGDAFVPIMDPATANSDLATTFYSQPGLASPGGVAVRGITVELIGSTGTDSITDPLQNSGRMVVWRVA